MYNITLTVWHHIRIMAFCFTRLADLERIGITIIILLIMPKTQLQFCHLFCYPNPAGVFSLQSTDPFEPPFIDPKYYTHPDNVKTMIAWSKTILKMIENTPEVQEAHHWHQLQYSSVWSIFNLKRYLGGGGILHICHGVEVGTHGMLPC